ncbi:MAG: transposase [Candidatus Lokiarchaeota archaeon]|nr:transposase [Candidatus Lokiarchaeota archaeon]
MHPHRKQESRPLWKDTIREVQSKRDHCKKGSNRWNKYHQKLCKMKEKCANQLRDFQHKISKQIVENTKVNTIIVGDLNAKEMARKKEPTKSPKQNKANKTLNHPIQNTGSLGRFVEFLTYKAQKRVKEC